MLFAVRVDVQVTDGLEHCGTGDLAFLGEGVKRGDDRGLRIDFEEAAESRRNNREDVLEELEAGLNRRIRWEAIVAVLVLAVLLLMAPLPFVPFANTLPGIGIILLCLGMAERDGMVIVGGYVVTLVSAVAIAALISLDGRSHWLEGLQLFVVYIIVALAFFFLPAM